MAQTLEHVLLARVGPALFGIRATLVERVLRMAALTPAPPLSADMVGLLGLGREALPVFDPRPRLGVPRSQPHPDHRLILVSVGGGRFLLWVDATERLIDLEHSESDEQPTAQPGLLGEHLFMHDGTLIALLEPELFLDGLNMVEHRAVSP